MFRKLGSAPPSDEPSLTDKSEGRIAKGIPATKNMTQKNKFSNKTRAKAETSYQLRTATIQQVKKS